MDVGVYLCVCVRAIKCMCSFCLYCALPHIWLCLLCHSTGVCLEASGLVSQGDLQWLFPRPDCSYSPRACTIPNTALECCWLHFFSSPLLFFVSFSVFLSCAFAFLACLLVFLYDFSLLNLFCLFQFSTDFN